MEHKGEIESGRERFSSFNVNRTVNICGEELPDAEYKGMKIGSGAEILLS